MHPIERLRYVARSGDAEHLVLVEETAAALRGMGDDLAGVVMSCRRLIERNPASGPLWTLCGRMLCAADPAAEAVAVVVEMEADRTPGHLVARLPQDARVTVIGWPETASGALAGRGDLQVVVVDSRGAGTALARQLVRLDVDAHDVDEASVAAAARVSDLVLLEADALGPDGFVAPVGSHAAAAVAHHAGVPVWLVAGAARAVPARTWQALRQRVAAPSADRPWDDEHDVVPLDLVDVLIGPSGAEDPAGGVARADGPVAPELLR
jgi:hypothetical protein